MRPEHVTRTWQYSIIVMCLRLYHVTNILHCLWREFWSRNTDVHLTYIHFDIMLTQFYVNFSRQNIRSYRYRSTPEILRFQPIPPLFFLYSPFKSRYVNSANSRQVYVVYSLFKIAILKNLKVILLKNII